MRKLSILAVAVVVLFAAACGKKAPPPEPPKKNDTPKTPAVNVHAMKPRDEAPRAKGKSYLTEYIRERDAAFNAKKEYDKVRRDPNAAKGAIDEPYINWVEHMCEALALANMHGKSGYDKDDLPLLKELKRLKTDDFKNALGPMDHPRVKAALKKIEESGQ